jgi:hypothetical protein
VDVLSDILLHRIHLQLHCLFSIFMLENLAVGHEQNLNEHSYDSLGIVLFYLDGVYACSQ